MLALGTANFIPFFVDCIGCRTVSKSTVYIGLFIKQMVLYTHVLFRNFPLIVIIIIIIIIVVVVLIIIITIIIIQFIHHYDHTN